MTTTISESLNEILGDLNQREKSLNELLIDTLKQANSPSRRHRDFLRYEANRIQRKLEGLRLGIEVIEDYRKREGL